MFEINSFHHLFYIMHTDQRTGCLLESTDVAILNSLVSFALISKWLTTFGQHEAKTTLETTPKSVNLSELSANKPTTFGNVCGWRGVTSASQFAQTHHEQQALALLVGGAAAQEPQQHQHGTNGDAEESHIDELHALAGEGPQKLEEGGAVHADPDAHGQQRQAAQLQGAAGKHTFSAPSTRSNPPSNAGEEDINHLFWLADTQWGQQLLKWWGWGVMGFGNEKLPYITKPLFPLPLGDTVTPQYRCPHSGRRIPFVRQGAAPPRASNYVSRPRRRRGLLSPSWTKQPPLLTGDDTSTLVSEGLMDNNPVDTERLRVGREARYGTLARTV